VSERRKGYIAGCLASGFTYLAIWGLFNPPPDGTPRVLALFALLGVASLLFAAIAVSIFIFYGDSDGSRGQQ